MEGEGLHREEEQGGAGLRARGIPELPGALCPHHSPAVPRVPSYVQAHTHTAGTRTHTVHTHACTHTPHTHTRTHTHTHTHTRQALPRAAPGPAPVQSSPFCWALWR